MKILAINGSHKKGKTHEVILQIEKKMKELGNFEFEYLFLKDVNLERCRGCFTCVPKGENLCPIKDDREKIGKQMLDADGIILASPVYAYNVTAVMKNFFDRFSFLFHRPCFFHKNILILSTTVAVGLRQTLNYLDKSGIWGFDKVHKLGVMNYPMLKDKIKKKTHVDINKTAENYYKSLTSKKPCSPTLINLIHFQVMRTLPKLSKEYWKADFEYYKDKMELDYYYPLKINPLKKIFSKIIFYWINKAMHNTIKPENRDDHP
jgi:multimeric flavodoxin WrbA